MRKRCTGLFAHSLDSDTMQTQHDDVHGIHRECTKCGYVEILPRSQDDVYFVNNFVKQHKQFESSQNKKELLQPMNPDGTVNDDFTTAYGYNPFDDRTKQFVPDYQKGKPTTLQPAL